MELEGKTAVITGGTSGMGRATVKLFAQEGANVVFTGTGAEKGKRVTEEVEGLSCPGKALFFQSDVSKEDEVEALGAFVSKAFGDCDILVNNAGIFIGGQIHETDLEAWDKLMDQLGNLHEAGQQLAVARERAAKAETEASFLRERLGEMREERDQLRRREERPSQAPTGPSNGIIARKTLNRGKSPNAPELPRIIRNIL